LYVELESVREELSARARETEAECRRWRQGDEKKRHRQASAAAPGLYLAKSWW